MTDRALARRLDRPAQHVWKRRREKGLPRFVAWSPLDAELRDLSTREIARKLGLTRQAVWFRKKRLGLTGVRGPGLRGVPGPCPSASDDWPKSRTGREWTASEDGMLGTRPDRDVARALQRSTKSVMRRRLRRRIAGWGTGTRPWTGAEEKLLGTKPDEIVAQLLYRPVWMVTERRQFLRIPPRTP